MAEKKYTLDEALTLINADAIDRRFYELQADREARLRLELDTWEEPVCLSPAELGISKPDWLIRDYIESGTVGFLNGIYGSAKSFIALDWACCVATGTSWFEHRIGEGNVTYVAAEGAQGIGRRYNAWCRENGRKAKTGTLDFVLSPVQLGHPVAVDWLYKRIIDTETDFLIIDTLARSTDGLNENDAIDMGKVITALYRLRDARGENMTTILVVHHTGWGDQSRSRGSTRLPSDTDFSFTTTKGDGIKPFTLKCTKLKEDRLPDTFNFTLGTVEVAEDVTSCVIRPAAPASVGAPADDSQTAHQAVLLALHQRDGQTSKELTESTGRSQPVISTATKTLREAGKIRGEQSTTDLRSWTWHLAGPERTELGKLAGKKVKSSRF